MSVALPFTTTPSPAIKRPCGNAASGILELPVLGGLTVGESSMINQQLLLMETSSFVEAAKAAEAIATEESSRLGREFALSEAFQIVDNAITGRAMEDEAVEIRIRHAARIERVAQVYAQVAVSNMQATVTALINQRLNLPEWGVEDTRTLHRALFQDIWQLAQDEQEAENNPSAPPTDEELKKPQPEEATGRKRRGKPSTGS